MNRNVLLTTALAVLVSGAIQAEESQRGPVVGATMGNAQIEDEEQGLSFDTDDTAWKVFGGYRFTENLSVQGEYVNFGDQEQDVLGLFGLSTDATGLNVSAVGTLPVSDRFDLFGQLGIVSWEADQEIRDLIAGTSVSTTEDGTDLSYGVGGEWRVMEQFRVRAEWQAFDVDDVDDVTMWSVGGSLRF